MIDEILFIHKAIVITLLCVLIIGFSILMGLVGLSIKLDELKRILTQNKQDGL
jgi:hypothetical protein